MARSLKAKACPNVFNRWHRFQQDSYLDSQLRQSILKQGAIAHDFDESDSAWQHFAYEAFSRLI